MKSCPYCKAAIEENARFCLYCMKPLVDKTVIKPPKRFPWIWITVVLAVILITGAVLLAWQSRDSAETPTTTAPQAFQEESSEDEVISQQPEIVYTYRAADTYDDITVYYVNPETDIVITGVEVPSSDGVYRIPATIDGKRVIAIMENAFTGAGSNARVVYIPDVLKVIWSNAFQGCPLTDIYFVHNIYIPYNAFPDSQGFLTIHCPQDCNDRFYRNYSQYASNYDAIWEEWTG